MDGQQQRDFIQYVQAARAVATNPHTRATIARPWRLSVMWRDMDGIDGMNIHFATEGDAQHALTLLVELYPDLVHLAVSPLGLFFDVPGCISTVMMSSHGTLGPLPAAFTRSLQ